MKTNNNITKHGLRKVLKAEFEEHPEFFELRKGFSDLPNCPYGNQHSAMGFDKQNEEYVWLVKSILKDSRLNKVQGN